MESELNGLMKHLKNAENWIPSKNDFNFIKDQKTIDQIQLHIFKAKWYTDELQKRLKLD